MHIYDILTTCFNTHCTVETETFIEIQKLHFFHQLGLKIWPTH